jgi:hypothetical protein
MESIRSGLVHIVRDFLVAHQTMRHVFARFRAGTLTFDEVQELVGDSERSVLFRMKERCHSLFRNAAMDSERGVRREILFDLAVGSLFHEAMKFRENFYQLENYAPRVHSLRSEAGEEASELFQEFQKILDGAASRLMEALQETEALLDQTCNQFRLLLAGYRDNGLIARCLIEERALVENVFEGGFDLLLTELYGTPAQGYVVAANSYLESAFFSRALEAMDEARKRYEVSSDLERLESYAGGMQAFLTGDYERSLCLLTRWIDAESSESDSAYASLALTAISRIENLVDGSDRRRLGEMAAALMQRIEPVAKSHGR